VSAGGRDSRGRVHFETGGFETGEVGAEGEGEGAVGYGCLECVAAGGGGAEEEVVDVVAERGTVDVQCRVCVRRSEGFGTRVGGEVRVEVADAHCRCGDVELRLLHLAS